MAQDAEKTIDQLNDEADIAADYLEGLLDIVDYEGDIEMGVRNNRPTVQIVADDEARETGEPVDLKPMNSFERKIIHDVVREEGMKSRSHGEEPHRYVTVYVKASAADDADEIDEA